MSISRKLLQRLLGAYCWVLLLWVRIAFLLFAFAANLIVFLPTRLTHPITFSGRWEWFSRTVFPPTGLGPLNLLANLGLILFLLLMGLELDLSTVAKRAKTSLTISLTGIIGTFALSTGVSKFFYENIPGLTEQTSYASFLLFIGVAMSVTVGSAVPCGFCVCWVSRQRCIGDFADWISAGVAPVYGVKQDLPS